MNAEDDRRLAVAYAAFRGERERRAPSDWAAARELERRLLPKPRIPIKPALSGAAIFALLGLALAGTLNGAERPLPVAQSFLPEVSADIATASRRHFDAHPLGFLAGGFLAGGFLAGGFLADGVPGGALPLGASPGGALPLTSRADSLPLSTASGSSSRPRATERDLWRQVADGMRDDDPDAARRALEALQRSGGPETRSKALLGMASLELAKGNCAAATSIATRVEQAHPKGHVLSRRARELKSRCP